MLREKEEGRREKEEEGKMNITKGGRIEEDEGTINNEQEKGIIKTEK